MAIDGLFMHQINQTLQPLFPAKINKLQQISDNELLFMLRSNNTNHKLLISTHSQTNRINLTTSQLTSPATPTSFIMVLRKYIDGGIIKSCTQLGLDRILHMEITAFNDLGDEHRYDLYIELMGKYANVVLVENNKIIDALKRIPPFEENKRPIFPGLGYTNPPLMDKKDPFNEDEIIEQLSLTQQFHGFSPLLAKEFEYRMHIGQSFRSCMDELIQSDALYYHETQNQFHCLPLLHLGEHCTKYPLMKGMDVIYFQAEEKERIRQQSGDLYKLVKKEITKNNSKLIKLKQTLSDAENCEQYRIYGDLLYAYAYLYPNKMDSVELEDFTTQELVKIPLNIKLDIKQNAKKYYQKYRKSKTAQIIMKEQIELCENEIEYFTILETQLAFASFEDALEIRNELIKNRYLKASTKKEVKKQATKPHYATYKIADTLIYVGKNNLQNDYLTFHFARKEDYWFHAKDYHGSHVIVSGDLDETIIRSAALLASYYSQGKNSSSVPVNYTQIKTLKKAKGKAIGQALLSTYKTIYIDPEEKAIMEIMEKYAV